MEHKKFEDELWGRFRTANSERQDRLCLTTPDNYHDLNCSTTQLIMAESPISSETHIKSPAHLATIANDHAPSISSPLNPDAPTRNSSRREQREKKDSLKKRENAAASGGRGGTPDVKTASTKSKPSDVLVPTRYNISFPESGAWLPPKPAMFDEQSVLYAPDGITEIRRASEQ
jgi:hypothetical protein